MKIEGTTLMSMLWTALGGLAWTAGEYAIHRYVGHGPKRTLKASLLEKLTPAGLAAEFNAEHLAHHADPTYFAPTARKLRAAAVGVPLLAVALAPLAGARRAASFALGFGLVYGTYEIVHRRIHTHPPTGPYGRWARHHHLLHHHKTPRLNHGVTTPLWDVVFKTYVPAERVRVPRHAAPVWMIDPSTGEVRSELANDYELASRRHEPPAHESADAAIA